MNFRHLLLFAALALAACNGSDSSTSRTYTEISDAGTFANAGGTAGNPEIASPDTGTGDAIIAPDPLAEVRTLVTASKVEEATQLIRDKGLRQGGSRILAEAGYFEAAYSLFAPEDHAVYDETVYDPLKDGALPAAIDERPAVKRHSMELDGKTIWYTASAGHLTAYAKIRGEQKPQASIFYTAYTRDDLPKADRPVTFFFNGGPGASSMYLHMGSFAPMRAVTNGPVVKPEWAIAPPTEFPLEVDKESLIDRTDLVFVDIVPGTGYSQAIAPNTNASLTGIHEDVELSRQFVTRYINANNRQASPKYLYGESYAGGTRVPKLARALLETRTIDYENDPSGETPKVLTGLVFHSPAFEFATVDDDYRSWLPTLAMTAEAIGLLHGREPDQSLEDYAESIRSFVKDLIAIKYAPTENGQLAPAWLSSQDGQRFTRNFHKFVNDTAQPTTGDYIKRDMILPKAGARNFYDARMYLDKAPPYDFSFFDELAITKAVEDILPDFIGYHANSPYIGGLWTLKGSAGWKGSTSDYPGIPDIVAALQMDPSLKLLAVHGYYDNATLFAKTESQLKGTVLDEAENFTLLDRIPVKNFAGGHMIYYSEEARVPMKKTLAEFYDAPPYGSGAPSGLPVKKLFVAAPSPVIALH